MAARAGSIITQLLLLSAFLCSCVSRPTEPQEAASQRFDFAAYRPATFAAIREENARPPGQRKTGFWVSTGTKYRVCAMYVGASRPLSSRNERILWHFSRLRGVPDMPSHFAQEVLFFEGGEAYWLPTQTVLLPHLEEELRAGDDVDLYIMYLGESGGNWYYVINEFQAHP